LTLPITPQKAPGDWKQYVTFYSKSICRDCGSSNDGVQHRWASTSRRHRPHTNRGLSGNTARHGHNLQDLGKTCRAAPHCKTCFLPDSAERVPTFDPILNDLCRICLDTDDPRQPALLRFSMLVLIGLSGHFLRRVERSDRGWPSWF